MTGPKASSGFLAFLAGLLDAALPAPPDNSASAILGGRPDGAVRAFAALDAAPVSATETVGPVAFHALLALPDAVYPSYFAPSVDHTLGEEGGYSDHPKDPGGATNRGITIGVLSEWLGRPATKAEVRALSVLTARQIYRQRYWNPVAGDELGPGVSMAVFDFAVNSGVSRSARTLQAVLGVEVDGAIGPMTLAAVRRRDRAKLVNVLCDSRLRFLRGLNTFPTFGKGWTNRVARVRAVSLAQVA